MSSKKASKITVLMLLAVMIMVVATGCSKSDKTAESTAANATGSASASPESEKPLEKVTLRIAAVYTPDHPFGPPMANILDEFTKLHPEVTIEKEFMPSEQMAKKLQVDLAANSLPEIFVMYPNIAEAEKAKAKKIVDLTPYLEADPKWKDGFIAGALDNFKFEGVEGIYAAPLGAFATGFYYNKEIFQKANVEPPKTFTELITVIGKLKEAGVTPISLGNADSWRPEHLFTALFYKLNGIDKVKELANRSLPYNSPEVLDTFKSMVQLADAGAFGKNYISSNYAAEVAEFNAEKSAMRYSGSWTVGETTGKDAPAGLAEKVGFFPFPYFEGKEATKDEWMGGISDSFAVSANATGHQKDMAIELVKAITSANASKQFIEGAHDLTAVKADVDPAKSGNLIAEVSKSMSTGKKFSGDFTAPELVKAVTTKFNDVVQAVLAKHITPEEAVKQMDNEIAKNK